MIVEQAMSEWLGVSGQAPWWQAGCQCTSDGGKKAWVATQDPDVWVHIQCGQPSPAVLEADVLNIMRSGPHHNELIDTRTLMSSSDYGWIGEYKWTPEIIVGSESGRQARVWVWKERADADDG